jgi:hypothetical protein
MCTVVVYIFPDPPNLKNNLGADQIRSKIHRIKAGNGGMLFAAGITLTTVVC